MSVPEMRAYTQEERLRLAADELRAKAARYGPVVVLSGERAREIAWLLDGAAQRLEREG